MKKVWVGIMPSICGYGIIVISKTEQGALKELKKAYYQMRKAWKFHGNYEMNTFKKAMEYFGGVVETREFDTPYDDQLRD